MNIEIIKPINELQREVWYFYLFDLTIVLNSYYLQKKESKRKRNWKTTAYYSRLDKRDATIKDENAVNLPDEVIFQAIEKVKSEVKHLKLSEYKH